MDRYDPLADVTDEDLRRIHTEPPQKLLPSFDQQEDKYERFVWDQYDWSKFEPAAYGYDVIRLGNTESKRRISALSGVYFCIVLPHQKELLTSGGRKHWYPLPRYRDDEIVHLAAYRSEGTRKDHVSVLMHKRILSLTTKKVDSTVDHINGYSMDNRDFNLRPASFRLNMHNRAEWKANSSGLMRWVEYRNTKKTLVGGVFMVDYKKRRSPRTWPVERQQLAHDWVMKNIKKLYGVSVSWIFEDPPALPKFPPLKKKIFLPLGKHVALPARMNIPF